MLKTLNDKICQAFSESADQYDLLASLHREIGRELMAKVVKESGADPRILDVGCGTGYLTAKAKSYFPESNIVGLDFSQRMLEAAACKHEGIAWVLGDAQGLPFAEGAFDIVVSNLAYQWMGDLIKAFSEAGRVLSRGGVLSCTLFGFYTCDELFQSLGSATGGKLTFTRLPQTQDVAAALRASGLLDAQVDYERIKIQFKDMWELINWLKSIGANNLPREGYVGKDAMGKAAGIYRERFPYHHGVCATFEVIWVHARKEGRG